MMRRRARLFGVPLLVLSLTLPALSQRPSRPEVLPLDSLSWMAGHWLACDGGTRHEGVWMGPSAGSMTGLFRTSEGAKTVRYETLLLEQGASGPVLSRRVYASSLSPAADADQWTQLRLRHFTVGRAQFSPSTPDPSLSVVIELTDGDRLRVSIERDCAGRRITDVVEYARHTP